MYLDILEELRAIPGEPEVLTDEPMSRHTTFRVGGNADVFVTPKSTDQAVRVVEAVRRSGFPFFIIGNGSNLLVSDRGFRGIVIRIYRNMSGIQRENNLITAEAGASLSSIAGEARDAGLTGFEFASGIPGTFGGAVVMNAGAYGGEMRDVLKSVMVLTPEGEVIRLPAEKLEMGYRTSIIRRAGYVILSGEIELSQGDPEQIRSSMKELQQKRISKQPLEYPSAGSTFKRPEGYFAGKLIEDAGLRGFSAGGAMVSMKHCGFVINSGNASAGDVYTLIQQVQERVFEKFGVRLEPEVRFLGDFGADS